MNAHSRECKALAGPNAPKQSAQPQTPRPDAAIRNFFVAVGNLGKNAGRKPAIRPARPSSKGGKA
ncbi:MAG: hypothetical protein ACRCTD_03120 [Beijerinckiaceae bacterium]